MSVGISLQVTTSPYQLNVDQAVRLRVEVTEATGLASPKIFRYLVVSLDPRVGSKCAKFDGVCSPEDLAVLPADLPTVGANPPWLRLSYVEVDLDTPAIVAEFLSDLYEDVATLCSSLQQLAQPTGSEVITA